ncbi:hypothetical protein [Mycobacterium hubeiense]
MAGGTGANSPLVDDLARAVHAGDWPTARAIGEYLCVDVTVAAYVSAS